MFLSGMIVRRISQIIIVSTEIIALLAFAMLANTSLVFAASPHFIGTPTITKNPNFSLTSNFKAAGLANVVSNVFLSSFGGGNRSSFGGTAELQCVNPGGNNPPPKQVTFGPLQGQVASIQPRDGQITGTVTLGPPPLPSASQICPNPNWSILLLSVTYFNVVLHIQQSGVDILTFNFGNVDPEVLAVPVGVVSSQ